MGLSWLSLVVWLKGVAPEGSASRKLLQLISIILIFEGVSVIVLFSYFGIALGILSISVGVLLLVVFAPRISYKLEREADDTPGIRLIHIVLQAIGGPRTMIALGVAIVVVVLAFNALVSPRPELGDLDTLSILFGAILAIYPFAAVRYRLEASFSLLFLGFVVIFLVIPQVFVSVLPENGSSSVGNLYVRYMLAAPFAGILDLFGIPADSFGSYVTIEFRDGSIHTLGISAYCAGLYSFSIFLAAFMSFVLVFERLRRNVLIFVLAAGLVVAYLGNLFRMVIIGVVGYYRGMDALLWAHQNVGWILFLSWSAVFWYLLLGYVSKHSSKSTVDEGN